MTMQDKLAEDWKAAALDLGIEINAPFVLRLDDQTELLINVHLPQFGGKQGILIVDDFDTIEDWANDISSMGFGFSTMSQPIDNAPGTLEDFREALRDWGWAGDPESAPDWL